MKIGSVIRSIRKKKHLSQIHFAKLCNLTQTSLSQIENGLQSPHAATIDRICKVLEVPEAYLYLLALDESNVPENKKDVFKLIFPELKSLMEKIILK